MSQLHQLIQTSQQVAATRSRTQKIELIRDYLRAMAPRELPLGVKYLSGDLPQGRIGLGVAAVRTALQQAVDLAPPPESPSLFEVHQIFDQIAGTSGSGATTRRGQLFSESVGTSAGEARAFLCQLVLGELRQGALEGVMVEAIARSADIPAEDVRRALMFSGDLAEVAESAVAGASEMLRRCSLRLFRPVLPMLAETADDVGTALARMGEAVWEYKLDGVRVQVHKDGGEVRVFTRHLKEITDALPEIEDLVRHLPATTLILDGEVLAWRADGRPHAFQTTMRRFGRTRNIETLRMTLPLTATFFDCLLYDGESLIDRPTSERHDALRNAVSEDAMVPRLVTADANEAKEFWFAALAQGHEGVMAKGVDAPYVAGGRGQSWLKIKSTYSLDLVVLAAEWGSGRRKGWLSNLHLGVRDTQSGQFVMVGKTFKGLTDAVLQWQTEQLLRLERCREEHTVYVHPQLVAEVAFNDVQRSPQYASGFALRFARVKSYRLEKTPAQADTLAAVAGIYAEQNR